MVGLPIGQSVPCNRSCDFCASAESYASENSRGPRRSCGTSHPVGFGSTGDWSMGEFPWVFLSLNRIDEDLASHSNQCLFSIFPSAGYAMSAGSFTDSWKFHRKKNSPEILEG